MKVFKVNKNINMQPYILGLPLQLFYIFALIIVLAVFLQLGGLSFLRFILGIVIVTSSYVVLKFINSNFLDQIGNDKYPDNIINDNYK